MGRLPRRGAAAVPEGAHRVRETSTLLLPRGWVSVSSDFHVQNLTVISSGTTLSRETELRVEKLHRLI